MAGFRHLLSRMGAPQPTRQRPRCANCDITVDEEDEDGERTAPGGRSADGGTAISIYCCEGCVEGGPCTC